MPWTVEQRREYQAAWRARNPTYQLDLRRWKRIEHEKIRQEFLTKREPVKRLVGREPTP